MERGVGRTHANHANGAKRVLNQCRMHFQWRGKIIVVSFLDSVESVFATPGGVEIRALRAKIIVVLRTKIWFRIVSGDFGKMEKVGHF